MTCIDIFVCFRLENFLKDVDNDAESSVPGGADVLADVAFYCRWQLETASLMQISISILLFELRAESKCHCQLSARSYQPTSKIETSQRKGNKLFAKFIAELEQKNKIIAWQIVERCALVAGKSQKKPIEIEFRNENQKPETQFQEEPKGKSSPSPSLHSHKSHLATHHTLPPKTTTTTHLST